MYYFFATNLITNEQRMKITETYLALDKDGNGILGIEEITKGSLPTKPRV